MTPISMTMAKATEITFTDSTGRIIIVSLEKDANGYKVTGRIGVESGAVWYSSTVTVADPNVENSELAKSIEAEIKALSGRKDSSEVYVGLTAKGKDNEAAASAVIKYRAAGKKEPRYVIMKSEKSGNMGYIDVRESKK